MSVGTDTGNSLKFIFSKTINVTFHLKSIFSVTEKELKKKLKSKRKRGKKVVRMSLLICKLLFVVLLFYVLYSN